MMITADIHPRRGQNEKEYKGKNKLCPKVRSVVTFLVDNETMREGKLASAEPVSVSYTYEME